MSYNVNRSITDTFYRYKMPRLMAKVEGKGNGIKTVIVNMVDVAKALGRPATYPCKYFGCELGAQTQFDFKNDRYIVNGSHDCVKLQNLLDGFIKRFVLCLECENPETVLLPNEKKGIIKQTCLACGYFTLLDMKHKLTTYILKNPPDVRPDQQGTSLTKRKERKKDDKNGSMLRPGGLRTGGSDTSDNDMNGDADDDDDWGEDTSDAAVKERQKDLTTGVKNLTISNDIEKTVGERLEIFFEYVNGKKSANVLKPGADVNVLKDISAEAERLEIKDNKGVMVLVEVLLDENIIKQISQYRILLRLFTDGNPKTQKYMLGAVEKLIEIKKENMLPKVPHLLKALYDTDVADEEVLLEWGKKPSKKYVSKETSQEIHAKAAPFLKWLQEAEEEESSDEEEDFEIQYDDRAKAGTLKEQEAKSTPSPVPVVAEAPKTNTGDEDDDDSDEVDIDNL